MASNKLEFVRSHTAPPTVEGAGWVDLNFTPPVVKQWTAQGWVPLGSGGVPEPCRVPPGTADGQVPVWDQTTQKYVPEILSIPGSEIFPPGSIYNYSSNLA